MNHKRIPASVVNADLAELLRVAKLCFRKLCEGRRVPSVRELRNEINRNIKPMITIDTDPATTNELFHAYCEQKRVAHRTMLHIESAGRTFTTFLSVSGVGMEADAVKGEHLYKFEKYLVSDRGRNRVASIMKIIRSFYSWCVDSGNIDESPFRGFKMPSEVYGRPVCLTRIERDYLTAVEIPDGMIQITEDRVAGGAVLRRVRDLFILQCHIGCRIGDYKQLTEANVIRGGIEYIPVKTKGKRVGRVRIPLSSVASEIIERYKGDKKGRLMPFMSDQKYNEYLKDLFQAVNLSRVVTRLNPKTGNEEKVPLYDMATSHLARRTFINILHKKVKNEVIASMTGHSKTSRAFSRYYDIDEEERIEAIKTVLE